MLHRGLSLYRSKVYHFGKLAQHDMIMKDPVVLLLMSIRLKPAALTLPQLLPELTAHTLFELPRKVHHFLCSSHRKDIWCKSFTKWDTTFI